MFTLCSMLVDEFLCNCTIQNYELMTMVMTIDDSRQSYLNPRLTYDDDCSIFKMAAVVRRKYDGKTSSPTYNSETEFRKAA